MKKNFRRFSAVMIAVIMVLAMGVSAFAATPSDSDTNTITVQNVEAGAVVKAYRIAEANYTDTGFTGYTAVEGVEIANLEGPTASEIGKVANDIATGTLAIAPVTLNASGDNYVETVPMGLYLVMVEHTNSTIYNPMIVSPNYTASGSDNTSEGGSVNAADDSAWAKKDEVDIAKTQADAKAGDDVAIGDDVSFKIETTIPSYAPAGAYSTPVFEITDTLSAGLTLNQNTIAVKTGNDVVIDEADYEIEKSAGGFTVSFDSEYIVDNGNAGVVITYTAKLNDTAGINFDENTNTASLKYTNSPTDTEGTGTQSDKTYTYTFGLNTKINASESEDASNEFVKVGLGKDGEGNTVIEKMLDGAEFALYDADASWNKVDAEAEATATSANGGKLVFEGLDAGKYILQETAAPEGYSLNDTEYQVEITANYNADGTLASYVVKIDGETLTEAATFTYTKDGEGNLTVSNTDAVEIPNTKLADLPSTGGIGTYIFTIVGVLIMGAAVGLFIMKRKHNA